jgi:hypothetical protein
LFFPSSIFLSFLNKIQQRKLILVCNFFFDAQPVIPQASPGCLGLSILTYDGNAVITVNMDHIESAGSPFSDGGARGLAKKVEEEWAEMEKSAMAN